MSLKGKEVLIIDDVPDVRLLGRRILENIGVSVIEADSVDKAFELTVNKSPHLIVLDLEMPGKPGFAFLSARREFPHLAQVPILVASGLSDKKTVFQAISLGATDYLLKPFSAAIFIQKVRKLLKDVDYRTYKFPVEEMPKLQVRVSAQIGNASGTGFLVESPVKLAASTRVTIEAPLLDQAGLGNAIYVTDQVAGYHGASGNYFSTVNVAGLDETLARKLRKLNA